MNLRSVGLTAVAFLLGVRGTAVGQRKFPPDSATNLQVLPKTMSVRDMVGLMRGFTNALGVRCQYCHVGEEGKPLEEFDFASDDKRTKQVARTMLKMVTNANQEYLAKIPERPTPNLEVRCAMCHRGVARPVPLGDIIAQAVASPEGVDSATRAYRGLKERYYGRAAYDFGEGTLTDVAFGLARGKQWDQAIGVLPKSPGYNEALVRACRLHCR